MPPPQKSKKIIFSTSDVFGNSVHMVEQTWECKKERHPEVVPFFPAEIEQSIAKPDGYRHSTADYAKDDTIAFERKVTGTNDTLRVIVQYDAITFLKGNTSGKITSVYLPDASYKKAQLGPFVPLAEINKKNEEDSP